MNFLQRLFLLEEKEKKAMELKMLHSLVMCDLCS